jgi:hypothetical protein
MEPLYSWGLRATAHRAHVLRRHCLYDDVVGIETQKIHYYEKKGYLRAYYYHWVDTSADSLFVSECIICTVVSAFDWTMIVWYDIYYLFRMWDIITY